MVRRAALTWILLIPVAILNGVIRRVVFEPIAGDLGAHQISIVTGSAAFVTLTYVMLHNDVEREDDGRLVRIGFAWVVATVVFEFGFGHYVAGDPWSRLLRDYDFTEGRVWPLVLLTLMVSPLLVKRLHAHGWRRREPLGV